MIGTSNARLAVGGLTVDIGSHQWGVVDGVVSLFRVTEAGYGAVYRRPYAEQYRTREVRFVKTEALMEQFRSLALLAMTTGQPVTFTPDVAVPGTTWSLDWSTDLTFKGEMNRHEVTAMFVERVV